MLLSLWVGIWKTDSQNTDMSFASSAAENLITILQARDDLTVKTQSSPVRGPECFSYNSHGSSIQESPSERESQIDTVILNVILWCLSLSWHCCSHTTQSLTMQVHHIAWYVRAVTFTSSFLVATADYLSTLSMSSTSLGSDSEPTGMDCVLWSSAVELKRGDTKGTLLKVHPP